MKILSACFLILISLLFSRISTNLEARDYFLDGVGLDSYPKVQLYFSGKNKKNLPRESISLLEKVDGQTKEIEFLKIIQSEEKRPVSVILSIQLSNWTKNQNSKQIVQDLLKEFSDTSKFTLQFFSDKTVLFAENLSKQEVKDKLQEMELGNENYLVDNLEFLYNNLSILNQPKFHILISPSDITKSKDISSVLNNRKTVHKIPIFVIGTDSLNHKVIASLSDGKFISIDNPNLNFQMSELIQKWTEPVTILEYESPFADIFDSFPSRTVEVEIEISNKKFLTQYELTPLVIAAGWFANVALVLTILTLTIVVLILVTYAQYQKNKRLEWEERIRRQEEIRKSDLYYHENVSSLHTERQMVRILSSREVSEEEQTQTEEELELDLQPDTETSSQEILNLPKGEAYERAFFIQKEGPNPGRQFVIYKDEIIIGRDPSSDLVLLDPTVSLKHAKIKRLNKTYYIFDLISERGVFINGRKLLKPRPLYDFDEVRIGKVLLLFRGN